MYAFLLGTWGPSLGRAEIRLPREHEQTRQTIGEYIANIPMMSPERFCRVLGTGITIKSA